MYRAKPEDGIAFVTGASSGIGRETALALARRGYRVAVTARRADALAGLAALMPEKIFPFPGDVTDLDAMRELIARIEQETGPIALAFLNAGVSYAMAERRGFDAAVIAKTYAVNVDGTVNCLEPLIAAMLARGQGQIAINASLAGYNGLPGSFAYGSSKAALIQMAESLQLTYGHRGVRFQVLCHGFVRSEMTAQERDYGMPFMIESEAAAQIICKGFERGGFEIAFPWPLVVVSKIIRMLPYAVRLPLIATMVARARHRG